MTRLLVIATVLLVLAVMPLRRETGGLHIGSKKFTEGVILGEILLGICQDAGIPAIHYAEFGGTTVVYDALPSGEIDAYVEYTGTLRQEIFGDPKLSQAELEKQLADAGIRMSKPLGFNNSYALAARRETADRLGLRTISDLARHPELRLGFSNEFIDRQDGWTNLKQHYGLSHQNVTGLDHDLAYRQLDLDLIDVTDVYTTDAHARRADVTVLEDDREYFPRYDAVVLYRADLTTEHPQLVDRMLSLEAKITEDEMADMNAAAELDGVPESTVAARFLRDKLGIEIDAKETTVLARLRKHTLEHLDLVRKSLLPAIVVAVALGIVAAKRPKLGQVILGAVGVVQTIPALALLVLLMAPVAYFGFATIGVGSMTAIAALFLYSLLPIVGNTAAGLTGIPLAYRESALALGLSPAYRLSRVELPLASPSILAGIKTAAVLNVGFATLGALVGAGGYGQPILTGIRLNDTSLILQGALPAAALALLVQGLFEIAERFFVPKGLRLGRKS